MSDFAGITRLIEAVQPWSGHLVIVGGWAHRLHRFHELAVVPGYQPLTTKDTDLAFANGAPLEGDIGAALMKAGFSEQLSGEQVPPVTHYSLGDAGFYAEFLTPLAGSGRKRDGTPDVRLHIAGVTAHKLRYLEILLIDPWVITVGPETGFPLQRTMDLQVVNPVSFIAQKLLIQKYRDTGSKRAQDILYIHDTLELFASALPDLRAIWVEKIRPVIGKATARKVEDILVASFSTVSDTIRDAARIPVDRTLTPERVTAFCEQALREVIK